MTGVAQYTDFISQNIALPGAQRIGVYAPGGQRIGGISLGHLASPNLGAKLYSFGALADIHLSIDTAEDDFRRAMTFLQDTEQAAFVCIAGDLTDGNTDAQWTKYAAITAEYNLPVYPVGGNHDASGSGQTDARFRQYTGHPLFYTVSQGNDVFIMISQVAWPSVSGGVQPFYQSHLQALYESLETNRNKRCFVFMHPFPWGGAGDPFRLYSSNAFFGTQGQVIYSLMAHYPNATWWHGHSHQRFEGQSLHDKANYDHDRGCHSIHIPSVTAPVQVTGTSTVKLLDGSQGYVVDVYANHIVLRGRDFASGRFLPIACYLLDTTLQTVTAGTYTDATGTITT